VLGATLALIVATAPGRSEEKKVVELNVSDSAPTFQLRDDRDKTRSSSDHFFPKWVVMC
jgi:hypothetical protein